jgi:putative NADPH-quinone reductase
MVTFLPIKLLKIENDGFHLLTEVLINGRKALVIVDTGASRSAFDRERIRKFVKQKKFRRNAQLASGIGTNTMRSHMITFRTLALGKIILKNYVAVLLDLSHVNKAYARLKISSVDGIIGSDLLKKHKAVVDYGKKTLRVSGRH